MAVKSGYILIDAGDYVINRIQGISWSFEMGDLLEPAYQFVEAEPFPKPTPPAGFYKDVFTTLRNKKRLI